MPAAPARTPKVQGLLLLQAEQQAAKAFVKHGRRQAAVHDAGEAADLPPERDHAVPSLPVRVVVPGPVPDDALAHKGAEHVIILQEGVVLR